jgi:segregation and condensation protein A
MEAETDHAPARLVVDLDGFEGPLDLLLELARRQKVDLSQISILALVDQYLAFLAEVRAQELEIAADHLVMAAWLAFLKSRLLLPRAPADETAEPVRMAEDLAERLRRLEAIRRAGAALMARPLLGRDVFGRGAPEPIFAAAASRPEASLGDLLKAFAAQHNRRVRTRMRLPARTVVSLAAARERLERMLGRALAEIDFDAVAAELASAFGEARSARASAFAAMLELAREGRLTLRQDRPFAPIRLRAGAGMDASP